MTERIEGMIDRLSEAENYSDIAWILGAPVENLAWSVVDDTMKANTEFQYKAGLPVQVERILNDSQACDWCKRMAGTYTYPNVPDDVWKRHDNCECLIRYRNDAGQNEILSGKGKAWETQSTETLKTRRATKGVTKPQKADVERMKKVGTGTIKNMELEQGGNGKVVLPERALFGMENEAMPAYEALAKEYGGTIRLSGDVTENGYARFPNKFTWKGKKWNLMESGTSIEGAIKNWTDQVDGFVVDIRKNAATQGTKRLSTVKKEITEGLQKYATKPTDVIIMKDGKILETFRYEI